MGAEERQRDLICGALVGLFDHPSQCGFHLGALFLVGAALGHEGLDDGSEVEGPLGAGMRLLAELVPRADTVRMPDELGGTLEILFSFQFVQGEAGGFACQLD